MKKLFILVQLLACTLIMTAQFRYSAALASNTTGTYTDLGTTGTLISTANFDNANSSAQNIGFSFYFNGIEFTQFILNTNGFIKLGNVAPATNTFDVLTSSVTNTIAPFNYDLIGGTSTTEYRVATTGSVGSRICTIQFENVRDASPSQYNNINFQIRLYETSNRIEFVYGTFTTSGAGAAFKEMIVGIKGTDSTFSVNATKSSATAWSATTFIDGVYPNPNTKFNNRNDVLPTSGRIFRFNPTNDASIEVYALAQLPKPYGVPQTVQARVWNNGGTVLNNLLVSLSVTGANTFSNSKTVTLVPNGMTVVNFDSFSVANMGTNVVTATLPSDDFVSNNSSSMSQVVNGNTFSYAIGSTPYWNLGFGTAAGMMLTKYHMHGSGIVTDVNVHLNPAANVGNNVYAVVLDAAGSIIAQSDPYYLTTSGDLNTWKDFSIYGSPAITNSDYYVGLAQTANPVTGYYPLSIEYEQAPARPGAYYYLGGLSGGTPVADYNNSRYMIQAVVNHEITVTGDPPSVTLPSCGSTANGSVSFTSIGTFPAGNIYSLRMNNSQWVGDTLAVTIGTLTSTANSGTINYTIPVGTSDGFHTVWIESNTVPGAVTNGSGPFSVHYSVYCPNPTDFFRSKQSGNWNSVSTWETSKDQVNWAPATMVPTRQAHRVDISLNDTVTMTTAVETHWTVVYGKLKLLNYGPNLGSFTFFDNFEMVIGNFDYTLDIKVGGTFQIVSSADFDSVIKESPRYFHITKKLIRIRGKLTIGDGSSICGIGYYNLATEANTLDKFRFPNSSIFEWNTTSVNTLPANATYFNLSYGRPILRITNIYSGTFGSSALTTVNGTLDINSTFSMVGSGNKILTDGIQGTGTLVQDAGSGALLATAGTQVVAPHSPGDNSRIVGIISGSPTIDLTNAGFTWTSGTTVLSGSNARIIGTGTCDGNFEVQTFAKITFDPGAALNIDNGNLTNNGTIDGTGKVQFTGSVQNEIQSPGIINAKLELFNKELALVGDAIVSSIDLLNNSHLRLDDYHLNMRTGTLVGDANNYIITNDTGRLARYVGSIETAFHIGSSSTSYTPVFMTNTGTPDNFKARVAPGVFDFDNNPLTTGNVDRTWFITDSLQGGSIVKLKMQWPGSAEQAPGLNHSQVARISRLSVCPLPRNCSGAFYDVGEARVPTDLGNGYYSIERSGVDSFKTNAFIVTSTPYVYTFTNNTNNGNWSDSLNWTPGIPAPFIIGPGTEVIINPTGTGDCISNTDIQIIQPGRLTVLPGKKLKIMH